MRVVGRLVPRRSRVAHTDALRSWTERAGWIVELRSGGFVGRGEASPLPGYSRDDQDTCRAELDGCWARLDGLTVDAPIRATLRDGVAASGVRSAAAVFAVETALLDLVARARGLPAWTVLRGDAHATSIPLSAIAEGGTAEELAACAARAAERGLGVIKIKVGGPEAADRDPPRLAAVRARVSSNVALRLDANQTLRGDDLQERLAALAGFGIELIEEPSTAAAALALRRSPIALALDESLMDDHWRDHLEAAAARGTYRAVVLKPMALGGFDRCLAIAEAADAAGLAAIVTHVFDGPIGSAAAACLALAIPGRVLPCGLDAHGRLERPIAALSATHVVPFAAEGLGLDGSAVEESAS